MSRSAGDGPELRHPWRIAASPPPVTGGGTQIAWQHTEYWPAAPPAPIRSNERREMMKSTTQRTTVIKVGGSNLEEDRGIDDLADYLESLTARGERIVLVHGGGGQIGRLHVDLDEPVEKVDGLRVTTPRGMEITTMVLCGQVNKRVVARLVDRGLPALGLSGIDAGILRAELVDEERLGRVGDAPTVDGQRLQSLLDAGMLPVVAPVSLGPDGDAVNVNADTAAHAIAAALRADSLDFVSDIPGVRVEENSDRVAARIRAEEVAQLISGSDVIRGGMVPKLKSAVEAVQSGVRRVRVGDLPGMSTNRATELVA